MKRGEGIYEREEREERQEASCKDRENTQKGRQHIDYPGHALSLSLFTLEVQDMPRVKGTPKRYTAGNGAPTYMTVFELFGFPSPYNALVNKVDFMSLLYV